MRSMENEECRKCVWKMRSVESECGKKNEKT